MIIELIICVSSFLTILLVNRFNTLIALVTCSLLVFCFVRYCTLTLNQKLVRKRLTKIWIGISFCYKIFKHIYVFCRQLIAFKKASTSDCIQPSDSLLCGDLLSLENEIKTIVENISSFYIHSWYDKISDNDQFIMLLNNSIKETLTRLCIKLLQVEKKKISYIILQLYLHFFTHFSEAKKSSENICWDNFQMKHWAMKDSSTEWSYLQSLVSSLLDKFGPSNLEDSLRSKYNSLLHTIVVEILTETLIQPLLRVLCSPTYINFLIMRSLLKELKPDEILPIVQHSETEAIVNPPIVILPTEDIGKDCVPVSTQNRLSVPHMCYPSKVDLTSESISQEQNVKVSGDCPFSFSSGLKSSSNSYLSDYDYSESKEVDSINDVLKSCDNIIKRSKSADYIRQMPQLKALIKKDYDIKLQKENNTMLVAVKFDSNSDGAVEQAEEAVEVEIPTLFTDVKITDTVQQNEEGLLPYTLYCIQYSGIFHDIGNSSGIPQFVTQVINIKRRFSEFLSLQNRLEDNPNLKNYLKGIKGPSKWLTLPFSSLDKKYIAERKVFLEGYLKELCSLAPIAQSAELQEFLAYGGDARISFVRRAGDINVPRIDKFLVRGVKGAIDIFKTALPNTAGEIESIFPIKTTFEDTSPDQRFNEHLLDFSSREPEIKEHIKNYFQNSIKNSLFPVLSKENNSELKVKRSSLLRSLHNFKTDDCCTCNGVYDNFLEEENPFGTTIIEIIDVAINLNSMNLGDLRTKSVLVFAPLLNRYVISKIDSITEQHIAKALHSLHQYLWSNKINVYKPKACQDITSNVDKIIECLDDILSSISYVHNEIYSLKTASLEKIKLFLLSIQHEEMNKCLLFHMFDVVIEFMCSKE